MLSGQTVSGRTYVCILVRIKARALGVRFRDELFPGDSNGFLRLHNSYRHDLKIYSSDEGRVQTTAAAFTKSFLALEGDDARQSPVYHAL